MPRFRVIAGAHEHEGTLYGPDQEAGPVFEAGEDLDKMFANKFIRLGAKGKKGRDTTHEAEEGGGTRVMDDDQIGEKIKRRSKLKQKKMGGKSMKGKPRPEDDFTEEDQEEAEAFEEDDLEDEAFTDVSVAGALGKKIRKAKVVQDEDDDDVEDEAEDEEDVSVSVGDEEDAEDDEEEEAPRRKKASKSSKKKSRK